MIEIKQISKNFGSNKQLISAIHNISLKINDGEIFGIVGYSGAGKSTLIRCINQLETVDKGNILIDGVDITSLKGKKLRKFRQQIGMIFQNFNLLWSRTVKENIKLPLEIAGYCKKQQEERANELLKMVELETKSDAYPSSLSGGQKQRVAIARALALKPKYLLSDEATSALDPKTTNDILNLLKKINEEYHLTIIMISHQMEAIQKICDRIAVMANGEIIEEGGANKIFVEPTHPLTKHLIHKIDTQLDIEDNQQNLRNQFPNGHLLRITFDTSSTSEPILYQVARQENIPFSIIAANLVNTKEGTLGVMYLYIKEKEEIETFIKILKDYHLEVEEI